MKTTLNEIKAARFQKTLLEKLLKHLGKVEPDDEPLSFLQILDMVGFDDTLKCFASVGKFQEERRTLAATYAKEVEHLMSRQLKKLLVVFERYASGLVTEEEFNAAYDELRVLEYRILDDDSVDVDVVHAVHAASYGQVHSTAFNACVAAARFESAKVLNSVRSTVAPARRAKALRAVRRIQSRRLGVGVAVESAWNNACNKLEKRQETQLRELLERTK